MTYRPEPHVDGGRSIPPSDFHYDLRKRLADDVRGVRVFAQYDNEYVTGMLQGVGNNNTCMVAADDGRSLLTTAETVHVLLGAEPAPNN